MNGCMMPDTCVSEPIGLDGSKCYVSCLTPPQAPVNNTVCPGGFDMNGCPLPDTYISTAGIEREKSTSIIKVIMKSI